MRAGLLHQKVTFQVVTRIPDGGGGFDETWGGDIVVRGQFVPERGQERLDAGRLEASLAGTLRIRSSSETRVIGEDYSVLIHGERFQIRSISNPDQRDKMLEMTVEKGVAT